VVDGLPLFAEWIILENVAMLREKEILRRPASCTAAFPARDYRADGAENAAFGFEDFCGSGRSI